MKRLGMCLALSLFCEMGYASWFTKKEVDGKAPSSFRAGVRHIEGKGIGYTKGYTTFEFFLRRPLLGSIMIGFRLWMQGRMFLIMGDGRQILE